jgi:hypothetical protein
MKQGPQVVVDVIDDQTVNIKVVTSPVVATSPAVADPTPTPAPPADPVITLPAGPETQTAWEVTKKRLDAIAPLLTRIDTARKKFEGMMSAHRVQVPDGNDAVQYLSMASAIGSDVMDIRTNIATITDTLNDLGLA